jgi:hypothetical protein
LQELSEEQFSHMKGGKARIPLKSKNGKSRQSLNPVDISAMVRRETKNDFGPSLHASKKVKAALGAAARPGAWSYRRLSGAALFRGAESLARNGDNQRIHRSWNRLAVEIERAQAILATSRATELTDCLNGSFVTRCLKRRLASTRLF